MEGTTMGFFPSYSFVNNSMHESWELAFFYNWKINVQCRHKSTIEDINRLLSLILLYPIPPWTFFLYDIGG
jgi:hypothetical protein